MERADAVRLVVKLEALADPARGGTPAERERAQEKADALIKRFGLDTSPPVERKPMAPRETTAQGYARGGFVPTPSATWEFDARTGAHTPNVKVTNFTDSRNWRIEVEL